MIQTLTKALQDKDSFYEQVSNTISAISGTITNVIGKQPSLDPTIRKLRERAKTELRHRAEARKQKQCIDVFEVIRAIDKAGDNAKLDTKTLRAKLITLLIIDTAARPSSLRNSSWQETKLEEGPQGKLLTLRPIATKDQHLSKNKQQRKLEITAFPFRKSICTVEAYKEYRRRFKEEDMATDLTWAGIVDGKATQCKGSSLFVKLSKPHQSLKATTVRSECKKYLDGLLGTGSSKELRRAVPSIIQFIDGATDKEIAEMFRWSRDDTFKKWYKQMVPDNIKLKSQQVEAEFPMSWKIRAEYIDKEAVMKRLKEKYTLNSGAITDYFNKA